MSPQPPAVATPYVGRAYLRGAAGPDAYDCWQLVRVALFDLHGVTLEESIESGRWRAREAVAAVSALPESPWLEVDARDARPGDVLAFDAGELHVGLVLDEDWMLHSSQGTGVACARWWRDPWLAMLIGVYRHRGLSR